MDLKLLDSAKKHGFKRAIAIWRGKKRQIDLQGADLRGANFHKANLTDADLRQADLREAHFTEANLMGADLRGAQLDGADFGLAFLNHVRLDVRSLDKVIGLEHATMSVVMIGGRRVFIAEPEFGNIVEPGCGNAGDLQVVARPPGSDR